MRFMVTGATGFAGGAIARRLLDEGEEVSVFVRDRAGADALAEAGARVHVGIVGDPNALAEAARGAEAVFHAAALRSHRSAPRALQWVNVAGTENVLNAARHVGCRRVVVLSCADVTLANLDRVNWNEDRDLTGPPLDAHARSKRLAEDIALATNLEVVCLRPAWLWGPGDTSLMPELCHEALNGGFRLVGAGDNPVSTLYIDHLVDAALSAAEVDAAVGHAYYVEDNTMLSAREFFGMLSEAAKAPPPRRGRSYRVAYALAWAAERLGRSEGMLRSDVVLRGRPTSFDVQRVRLALDWDPDDATREGMRKLGAWVEARGGAEGVAAMRRPPATAASVDDHAALAGDD